MKIFRFFLMISLLITGCAKESNHSLTTIASPGGSNSKLPFLTSDKSGNIFLSWVEPHTENDRYTLYYSRLQNDSWSSPKTVASSDSWFINWADYPSIVADTTGIMAAHVLNKKPGNTYSYDVNIYLNANDSDWSKPITPHLDSTATEHGFVSIAPWNDKLLAIWLDGRKTADRTEEEYFDIDKAMTLRSALIDANGTVTKKQLIDTSVCDCCNTSIALTGKGAIAAYRDRTDDEIRDIYVSRFDGESWTEPTLVHNDGWKIAACPVNGPSVSAADSTVVVAWYTAANNKRMVKAAVSTDYGKSFAEPVIVSSKNPVGRVHTVIDSEDTAVVSWMEKESSETFLKFKMVTTRQDTSKSFTVTPIDGARSSGFPQMVINDNRLIFAWTQPGDTTSVKTAFYPLPKLELSNLE